jgi:glutaminyl-peptide cyclotransferase
VRAATGALIAPLAVGGVIAVLVATDSPPFGDGDGAEAQSAAAVPRPDVNRFSGRAAYRSVERQVALGPRPAGSTPSRQLAERLRRALPGGRFEEIPGHPGLRNVIGTLPGRDPGRLVVLGAHYDTKDIPGFVGANDGAAGTAIVTGIARTLKPRQLRPTIEFILFDGEESPAGTPNGLFARRGLRGSKAAAPRYRDAEAMILLDFVGEKGLRIPREFSSARGLWRKLRAAARRVGVARVFPPRSQGSILDDHIPFLEQGVPAIDLIDFDFPCFHRRCDDLSRISARSLDAVGETVLELLPTL